MGSADPAGEAGSEGSVNTVNSAGSVTGGGCCPSPSAPRSPSMTPTLGGTTDTLEDQKASN